MSVFVRHIRAILACAALLSGGAGFSSAQGTGGRIDYNQTYRFPLSIGFETQFVSPANLLGTDYQGNFSVLDISALGRFPLSSLPVLQPTARLGLVFTTAEYDAADPDLDKFDNTRFYLNGGLGYLHKFNKQLEAGAELEAGVGYSIFPNIDPVGGETHGAWNFQSDLGGRVVFNPSFNLSISFHPSLGYLYSFSPLERFNGFVFSLGIGVDYRLGTDPDDPRADIRSIQFGRPEIKDMFAAMQSYYVGNPAGEISITNTEKYPLTDLEISFFQPGYMNIATPAARFDSIAPGETLSIPLTASFDKNIFSLVGVTPLTGEIRADYTLRSRKASQTIPVTYDLYDKNAITWDDDRKVAAFITSGDSALGNYVSFLRQTCKDVVNPGYSEVMQTAMQVYCGLTEIGCIYQRDPVLSFENAQGNKQVIDTVNLPRETLTKLSGDCDDLTVLFNAIMESAGIATGFITVPGHIYSVFATGIPARDYQRIHPDKKMTIPIDGNLWVPLEITFIGEEDFPAAWKSGAEEFARFSGDGKALGLYFTREAQSVYRPVGFEERDLGLQYGDRTKIVRDFDDALNKATRLVIEDYQKTAMEDNSKGSWNRLGIVAAMYEDYPVAEKAFYSALSLDRNYVPPKVNLANVYYKQEEYQNALRLYHEAEARLRDTGQTGSVSYARLLLNISRTYYEVENFSQAARYSERLSEVSPELADRYAYLADGAGGRAANVGAASDILYIEE